MPVHNPKWTAEAIGNILENAVKYSPKGSRIFIETTMMELYVQVKITDEGPGICEAEYNRIFRRFYRGKQAEEQEGSGLGLYLAQVILQSEKDILQSPKAGEAGHVSRFFCFWGDKGGRSSDSFVRTFLETVRGMSDFLCRIKDRKTTGEEFALWKF